MESQVSALQIVQFDVQKNGRRGFHLESNGAVFPQTVPFNGRKLKKKLVIETSSNIMIK